VTGNHQEQGQEQALFYSIGALDQAEKEAFERHLEEGCRSCLTELREFQAVAFGLALTAPAQAPSKDVRLRLLSRANESRQVWKEWNAGPSSPLLTLRSDEGEWQATGFEGVSVRRLSVDNQRGTASMLVRMAAGSSYPRHRHGGAEECFVIQGDLHVAGMILHAGDYQRAASDSVHGVQSTENGCTLFIMSSLHDELL
jgi:anti-sigma factor ChrR (cupin superfamily)